MASIKPVSTGGFIAVGASYTPSGGATADINVVRMNSAGGLLWARTFDIGGNDFGYDVVECPDGNFAITGYTDNTGGCCTTKDIFILKIGSFGTPLWTMTYGGLQNDVAFRIIVSPSRTGNSNYDFVLAGSTGSFGAGSTQSALPYIPGDAYGDAFMMRTDSAGNLKWGRTYGGAIGGINGNPLIKGSRDFFYSIAEVTTGTYAGDLVAVGHTLSYPRNTTDSFIAAGFAVRTDANGMQNVAGRPAWTSWTRVYRGVVPLTQTPDTVFLADVVSCITAANINPNPTYTGEGNIMITGQSNSRLHLLYVDPSGAIISQGNYSGTTGMAAGTGVREITQPAPFNKGNFVAAGVSNDVAGLGGLDILALEVAPNAGPLLGAPVWSMVYGGAFNDISPAGIEVVPNSLLWGTPGFIVIGTTNSFTNPVNQMYLIKTNMTGSSGCNQTPLGTNFASQTSTVTVTTETSRVRVQSVSLAEETSEPETLNLLCFGFSKRAGGSPDGLTDNGGAAAPHNGNGGLMEGMAKLFPNPVKSGTTFRLDVHLTAAVPIDVIVSDIAGKIVLDRSAEYPGGAVSIPVNTRGWAPGSYLITISAGGRKDVQRVVVTDK